MNPSKIKIYTDEDVTNSIVKALKRRGYEAWTTPEQGNRELTDEEQLKFATSMDASILTHNVKDFPRIHYEFMKKGISHKGIIVAKQVSVGEIVKGFLRLAAEQTAEDMDNRLEYLSNW